VTRVTSEPARDSLREREDRQAWDRYAIEAMRQVLLMAPPPFSDAMADAPALLADKCAEVADRMLEKRRGRFGPNAAGRGWQPEPIDSPAGRRWCDLPEEARREIARAFPTWALYQKESVRWERWV